MGQDRDFDPASVPASNMIPAEAQLDDWKASEDGSLRPMTDAQTRYTQLARFRDSFMTQGVDYGPAFPGSNKDVLLKPGAEKLLYLFGLRSKFDVLNTLTDWTGDITGQDPLFYFQYRCTLIHLQTNQVVGDGIGSCNSWETKYRYRWVNDKRWEELGRPAYESKSVKTEQLWEFAYKKRETSGQYARSEAFWESVDAGIADGTITLRQEVPHWAKGNKTQGVYYVPSVQYRIPNPDIFEQVNTFDKMAQKRAMIAATLVATGASALFTQDIDDWHTYENATWLPSWGEFYNNVLPELPTLISAEYEHSERVTLLSQYIRDHWDVSQWHPHLATELKIKLLVEEKLIQSGE